MAHSDQDSKMYRAEPPNDEMKKVLVLYVGGVMGYGVDLDRPSGDLVYVKDKLREYCRTDPTMNDINYLIPQSSEVHSFCVLPSESDNETNRVAYLLYEYDKLIASYNITPADWKIIAKDIQVNYEDFDGFVLLHGVDTMTYTASALSFMFENLSKCIVLTGAFKPIFDIQSDAKSNLKTSISVAGTHHIPEVTIFFRDRLLRGNRSVKRGAVSNFAFDSLNVPPLLQIGSHINADDNLSKTHKKFKLIVNTKLNTNVSFIRLYPGLPIQIIKASFEHPMEGVVMQAYGPGNIPSDRIDLVKTISNAIERGVIVANCTQSPMGPAFPVSALGTGQLLEELGVIFLSDITVEAAITKLMYVLSKKKLSLDEKKRLMTKPLRGEMTEFRV